jgi:hypothetical protein
MTTHVESDDLMSFGELGTDAREYPVDPGRRKPAVDEDNGLPLALHEIRDLCAVRVERLDGGFVGSDDAAGTRWASQRREDR